MQIYGIKTCDTCRKALKWLDAENIDYVWHDMKSGPLPQGLMKGLVQAQVNGDVKVINKSSKTWRELGDEDKELALDTDVSKISSLLAANPLLVKRPLIDHGNQLTCGFTQDVQSLCKTA